MMNDLVSLRNDILEIVHLETKPLDANYKDHVTGRIGHTIFVNGRFLFHFSCCECGFRDSLRVAKYIRSNHPDLSVENVYGYIADVRLMEVAR